MPRKLKIMMLAAFVACLAIISAGTSAYFTTEARARNVITTGKIDIGVDYPKEAIAIMPGDSVRKAATVYAADDTQPAWVRAKAEFTVYTSEGEELELSAEETDAVIALAYNTEGWTESDGWWYRSDAISRGETDIFFDEIAFSGPNMTNKFQNCTLEVCVTAQAVQKANNGDTVQEALGWPED